MTRLLAPEPISGLSTSPPAFMSNYQDFDAWQNPYPTTTNLASHEYSDRQISSLDVDATMYHHLGHASLAANPTARQLLTPDAAYGDSGWPSDVDIGTPSTVHSGFSNHNNHNNDMSEFMSPKLAQKRHQHTPSLPNMLSWPMVPDAPGAQHSRPLSSYREDLARPAMQRAHTGPEARQRRITVPMTAPEGDLIIKRSGSEESEEDDVPDSQAAADLGNRNRKRQRIPHTAVERRYRENLNAHLDRLRQAVPALASRRSSTNTSTKAETDSGVKPSKCEILSGAIDHIGALGRENEALRDENRALRHRTQELERWYSTGMHQSAFS